LAASCQEKQRKGRYVCCLFDRAARHDALLAPGKYRRIPGKMCLKIVTTGMTGLNAGFARSVFPAIF
jgi:hypothetical protein